jgi:hypothetical protein
MFYHFALLSLLPLYYFRHLVIKTRCPCDVSFRRCNIPGPIWVYRWMGCYIRVHRLTAHHFLSYTPLRLPSESISTSDSNFDSDEEESGTGKIGIGRCHAIPLCTVWYILTILHMKHTGQYRIIILRKISPLYVVLVLT